MSFSDSQMCVLDHIFSILENVPLDYTSNYERAKNSGLYEISHKEETENLLQELRNREDILRELAKLIGELGPKWQEMADSIFLLKAKISQGKEKLNDYTNRYNDLLFQNQTLSRKLIEMSDILDEKEQKNENLQEKLTQTQEQLENYERTNKINAILDTEKSIGEYLKSHIDDLKNEFPSYFCECHGKFPELKASHQKLVEKYQTLLENQNSWETNLSQKIIKQQFLEKNNKEEPKRSIVTFTTTESIPTRENVESHVSNFKRINKRISKRTSSLLLGAKKSKEPSPIFQKAPKSLKFFIENLDDKETPTLLSDMENSPISKQETRDLINSIGFKEYIQNQEDLKNAINFESYFPPTLIGKVLRVYNADNNGILTKVINLSYIDIAIFMAVTSMNLWMKVIKKMTGVFLY